MQKVPNDPTSAKRNIQVQRSTLRTSKAFKIGFISGKISEEDIPSEIENATKELTYFIQISNSKKHLLFGVNIQC